jgi:hypothetical protein
MEAIEDLMKELSRVRREVSKEYDWLKERSAAAGAAVEVGDEIYAKRKKLMSLFMKDLTSGVGGDVLSNKIQRDSMTMSLKFNRVHWHWKLQGWIFIGIVNLGMLFYIYLFAMNQTQSRQLSWFHSFLFWLLFEIFVSSTGLVVLVHLLIPLYVLGDVLKLKEKVLKSVISYRNKHHSHSHIDHDQNQDPVAVESNSKEIEFNSAKYLFTSWRVASLLQCHGEDGMLPESRLILHYTTPWPNKTFGSEGKVSEEYDQAILLDAVVRILMYFLCSFLHCHVLLQEIIIQMLWNSGCGFFVVWLIRLSQIYPLLPICPVAILLIVGYLLVRAVGRQNDLATKLKPEIQGPSSISVQPIALLLKQNSTRTVSLPERGEEKKEEYPPRRLLGQNEGEEEAGGGNAFDEAEAEEDEEEERSYSASGDESSREEESGSDLSVSSGEESDGSDMVDIRVVYTSS